MAPFSPDNVRRAMLCIPSTDTKALRALRDRARAAGLQDLCDACEAELTLRGAAEFDQPAAQRHAAWSSRVEDLPLEEAIAMAFSEAPPSREELLLLGWISQHPGISHSRLTALRGKGDVALILGHLVYDRFGFFRRFLTPGGPMSDVLLARCKGEAGVTYRLQDAAQSAFRTLAII